MIECPITVGPDGNLLFTEWSISEIARVSTDGSVTTFRTPTLYSSPHGITAGPDGNLRFTEPGSAANAIGRIIAQGHGVPAPRVNRPGFWS